MHVLVHTVSPEAFLRSVLVFLSKQTTVSGAGVVRGEVVDVVVCSTEVLVVGAAVVVVLDEVVGAGLVVGAAVVVVLDEVVGAGLVVGAAVVVVLDEVVGAGLVVAGLGSSGRWHGD